ncbi:hypothetical protein [Pontibacter virosus]|nr:hypothetical protein [Pontibacter virosus]
MHYRIHLWNKSGIFYFSKEESLLSPTHRYIIQAYAFRTSTK